MRAQIVITAISFLSIAWIVANPKEIPTAPVMIIESFGTIPAAETILPEDTLRFYLPDSVGYSDELTIINPFYNTD